VVVPEEHRTHLRPRDLRLQQIDPLGHGHQDKNLVHGVAHGLRDVLLEELHELSGLGSGVPSSPDGSLHGCLAILVPYLEKLPRVTATVCPALAAGIQLGNPQKSLEGFGAASQVHQRVAVFVLVGQIHLPHLLRRGRGALGHPLAHPLHRLHLLRGLVAEEDAQLIGDGVAQQILHHRLVLHHHVRLWGAQTGQLLEVLPAVVLGDSGGGGELGRELLNLLPVHIPGRAGRFLLAVRLWGILLL